MLAQSLIRVAMLPFSFNYYQVWRKVNANVDNSGLPVVDSIYRMNITLNKPPQAFLGADTGPILYLLGIASRVIIRNTFQRRYTTHPLFESIIVLTKDITWREYIHGYTSGEDNLEMCT